MKKVIKYLDISDLHLGHDKNKTADIVYNLEYFFNKYKSEILKVDIIFISGDTFDKLLSMNSREGILAFKWLANLAMFCKDNHIRLRILEGTPSHDWKQVQLLSTMLEQLNIKDLDYKYIPILDIEYIPELKLNIMYIPDEWKESSELIYKDAKAKLKEHGLDKVDIIIMHGAFKYQIPQVESIHFHDEKKFMQMVKYNIVVGHVHKHSIYDKILVPGSFDKLTHADGPDDKGGLLVTLFKDSFAYKFLKNERALNFKTIIVSNSSLIDVEKELDKLNNKKKYVHVRLMNKNKDNKIGLSLNELKNKYKYLQITITNKDTKVKNDIDKKSKVEKIVIKLDKNTIKDMINKEVNNLNYSNDIKANILEELELVLN